MRFYSLEKIFLLRFLFSSSICQMSIQSVAIGKWTWFLSVSGGPNWKGKRISLTEKNGKVSGRIKYICKESPSPKEAKLVQFRGFLCKHNFVCENLSNCVKIRWHCNIVKCSRLVIRIGQNPNTMLRPI